METTIATRLIIFGISSCSDDLSPLRYLRYSYAIEAYEEYQTAGKRQQTNDLWCRQEGIANASGKIGET
jgi:hypothetical protein